MIRLHVAQEQSALPKREPFNEQLLPWELVVDKAIVAACGERKFEAMFDYDHDLVCLLEQNYRKDGYKIKVLTASHSGGDMPEKVKLSWYPKQHIQGETHA